MMRMVNAAAQCTMEHQGRKPFVLEYKRPHSVVVCVDVDVHVRVRVCVHGVCADRMAPRVLIRIAFSADMKRRQRPVAVGPVRCIGARGRGRRNG